MNLVSVANACAVECERQQVGIQELGYLIEAYRWLDERVRGWNTVYPNQPYVLTYDDILMLGLIIEPKKNGKGFRTTPVTFQNQGSSCKAEDIPEKLSKVLEFIHHGRADYEDHFELFARTATYEFLWTHPFDDGNGRLGFLVWNLLNGSLSDPTALPDFNW